jgi:SAM-dependent methyltransferase
MHASAMAHGDLFFRTYVDALAAPLVLDLGAQDVYGSLRSVAPPSARYVGADLAPGPGVDVVLADPYVLPFETGSVDVVVSTSCFEHAEFFWLTLLEVMRVLKRQGIAYLNMPSNGAFHRYPVDCWRFYPDSGLALARWAQRNGYDAQLAESFTGQQAGDQWNDFVCVLLRDASSLPLYPRRMLHTLTRYSNGLAHPDFVNYLRPQELTEDQRRARPALGL